MGHTCSKSEICYKKYESSDMATKMKGLTCENTIENNTNENTKDNKASTDKDAADKDSETNESNDIPAVTTTISEIRQMIAKLKDENKTNLYIGEKIAESNRIYILDESEVIPFCPFGIREMLIQDHNSASLNSMIETFETIVKTSSKDVLNLKRMAGLVCAHLSFVTYHDPYTKVERFQKIENNRLDDLRNVYNMVVVISQVDEGDDSKDLKVISAILNEIIHVMKEKLLKSVPELF